MIFPFELEFWQRWGVEAEFVGHPLADLGAPTLSREEFATQEGLNANQQWIALLPGSRRKEVLMNLPEMLKAAEKLGEAWQYVLPVASTLDSNWLKAGVQRLAPSHDFVLRFSKDARSALAHCRAAVVASGTATVMAAMMGTPFVMVYRVSPATWILGRPLVGLTHFAMVNLIAGEEVVPELVQSNFTTENIVAHLKPLLAEIHVAALNRAKAAQNLALDMLARVAIIKFLRIELNGQFAQVLERCRMILKNSEGGRHGKGLEYRERVATFQVAKKIVLRKTGQELFRTMREIDKETLAKMRRSLFGNRGETGYKLLLNPLMFTEDGRDIYLNAEHYVLLGTFDRDRDRCRLQLMAALHVRGGL